jgi:hypothetical protein
MMRPDKDRDDITSSVGCWDQMSRRTGNMSRLLRFLRCCQKLGKQRRYHHHDTAMQSTFVYLSEQALNLLVDISRVGHAFIRACISYLQFISHPCASSSSSSVKVHTLPPPAHQRESLHLASLATSSIVIALHHKGGEQNWHRPLSRLGYRELRRSLDHLDRDPVGVQRTSRAWCSCRPRRDRGGTRAGR